MFSFGAAFCSQLFATNCSRAPESMPGVEGRAERAFSFTPPASATGRSNTPGRLIIRHRPVENSATIPALPSVGVLNPTLAEAQLPQKPVGRGDRNCGEVLPAERSHFGQNWMDSKWLIPLAPALEVVVGLTAQIDFARSPGDGAPGSLFIDSLYTQHRRPRRPGPTFPAR